MATLNVCAFFAFCHQRSALKFFHVLVVDNFGCAHCPICGEPSYSTSALLWSGPQLSGQPWKCRPGAVAQFPGSGATPGRSHCHCKDLLTKVLATQVDASGIDSRVRHLGPRTHSAARHMARPIHRTRTSPIKTAANQICGRLRSASYHTTHIWASVEHAGNRLPRRTTIRGRQ